MSRMLKPTVKIQVIYCLRSMGQIWAGKIHVKENISGYLSQPMTLLKRQKAGAYLPKSIPSEAGLGMA